MTRRSMIRDRFHFLAGLFSLLTAVLSASAFSQAGPDTVQAQWKFTYRYPFNPAVLLFPKMIVDPRTDDTYLLCNKESPSENYSILIKFDRMGDTLWTKNFENAASFVLDSSGNIYIGDNG